MSRVKKFVIPFFLLLIIIGGVFWWQNQKDVMELNKNLPEGIKIIKSLDNKYRIINKIDGYEFKIPDAWQGIEEIIYISERTEEKYTGSSIELKGKIGGSRIVYIDLFKNNELNLNLSEWAKVIFDTFSLVGEFSTDKVGQFEIAKTKENVHLLGMDVYFFRQGSRVYSITNGSEEFIKDIIINGKW
jgi:hypothetical protein